MTVAWDWFEEIQPKVKRQKRMPKRTEYRDCKTVVHTTRRGKGKIAARRER